MIRLGILRREQLEAHGFLPRLRAVLAKNRISFQLLRTLTENGGCDVRLFDRLMALMCLHNGVKRTTFRARFATLDPRVNELLAARFPRGTALDVHDWAASDCITSMEWARALLAIFPNAHVTASDAALYVMEISTPDGDVFIAERGGAPLQYIRAPFVIRLSPPEPKALIVNHLMSRAALRKFEHIRGRLGEAAARLDAGAQSADIPPFHVTTISVIHPEAAALRQRDLRFGIEYHSVFEPLRHPADVIRSMNIFNRAYFPPERLMEGVRAVERSLKPGGIWIVGRTASEGQTALGVSILEKGRDGFQLVERLGAPSEVEELALLRAATQFA